jgi:hypothetical protein
MPKILKMFFFVFIASTAVFCQDSARVATKEDVGEVKEAVDGMNETLQGLQSTIDALKKIKISGYIQAQYQTADTAGSAALSGTPSQVANYTGGALPQNVRSRFSVRRGRFKINYDNDLTQYVLQVDVTQNGLGIKDAYASIREPWMRTFGLTAGVFDRPFGFEISYSSGNREAPERTRMYQTLFPGERELGAKIEILAENGPLSYFNLKAGVFNGVLSTANENDRNKDFIGRVGFTAPFQEQNLSVEGGLSVYSGKTTSNSKYVYSAAQNTAVKKFGIDSSASNLAASFGRAYVGGDLQVYYDLPVIGGLSLRAEYISGQQPGTDKSNVFYNPGDAAATDTKSAVDGKKETRMYIRKFSGWYLAWIQNLGLKNQFVMRYDRFDPNTDIAAADIGAPGSNFNFGDIKYSTLGIGWIYHWDANVKFTLYYDIVSNDKVNPAATGSLALFRDDVKDNVMTLRMQIKF